LPAHRPKLNACVERAHPTYARRGGFGSAEGVVR
jgi:hypothetical protein